MKTSIHKALVCPMSVGDLDEVVALEKASHPSAWSKEHFVREMENPCAHLFVLREENRLLGYLVFWMIQDEVHLLNLTIDARFRRRGLGRRLMAFLFGFAWLHGITWMGLEVRKSNHAALALYRSFGFRQRRVRRAYYQDTGEDGIIMEREFDGEPTGSQPTACRVETRSHHG